MSSLHKPSTNWKIFDISHDAIEARIYELGGIREYDREHRIQWMSTANGKKVKFRQEGDRVFIEHQKSHPTTETIINDE